MDADTYYIDYSTGNGSRESSAEEYDSTAPIEHDGRAKTRTGFNGYEKDNDKLVERYDRDYFHWQWLSQMNDGVAANDIDGRRRRADARRDAETFASQLCMTKHQRERVVFLIDNLDTLYHGSIPAEGTVLAIISLVANEDGWIIRQTSDDPSDNRGPNVEVTANGEKKEVPLFTKLMYDCGMSPQKMRTARERLRGELTGKREQSGEIEMPMDLMERIESREEPWRDEAVMMALTESELTAKEIAAILDCGVDTLFEWAVRHGLDPQKSYEQLEDADDPVTFDEWEMDESEYENGGVYILRLENDAYYVGSSRDVEERISRHFDGGGSKWTYFNEPICVEKIVKSTDWLEMLSIEWRETLRLMREHGTDYVRGSVWHRPSLDLNPPIPIKGENESDGSEADMDSLKNIAEAYGL